jgi:uncharacterized protein YmfQ (DUF2313 family)
MGGTVTPEDYARQLSQLLPRGYVWTRDPHSRLYKLLLAVGDGLSRVHTSAQMLLREFDPRQADELIDNWETDTGLPDECTGPATGLDARRGAVMAKRLADGGASLPFFTELAAGLGYTIDIEEFGAFTTGSGCDEALNNDLWQHTWRVNVMMATDAVITDDEKHVLECVIGRAAPGHTEVRFAYVWPPVPTFWFDFTA